jgi:DNA-binding SARP family transcriptional activator
MQFRILGPLEVHDQRGRALDLTRKQRALLASLLLHANETVSTDKLIEHVWGAEPPDTAAKALQVYVSQLRRLLDPDRTARNGVLVTRPRGYALVLGPHELDLHTFERLRREAREALADKPEVAAEKLRETLSLWRGPPLADLAFEPFAQGEIARLEELRLVTFEDRIEADLALGRHADVVGELEALVAEHPLRERLRAQLMLALYRSRRQAEALEAYQAARRTLVDELGIEPSPELQELERRILRQDAALELEPRAARRAAESPTRHAAGTFVARQWELATLEAGLEDALAGRGRLFLLVGEAGIGKSRLADEFAARAKGRGTLILWGRCWEAGGAPAYWPWVQLLRTYLRTRDPESLRAELGGRAPELAQLLPELNDFYPDLPPLPTLDPDSARFRLFDSVAHLLRSAARERTLVLVLDDLHVADEPSLLLLRFLAGELPEIPVLVVGTYREEDAAEDEPVSMSLSELRRLPSRHLRLGGLGSDDVATYIRLATGITPPDSLVEAIHAETDGNPLFVGEVVRLLAAEGRMSEAPEPGWRLQMPPGLHEVIARRLRGLSKDCRRLLTLASVLGREFSLETLEQASDSTEDELLDVLDEAFAARVLADVPGAVGRVRFSHARVRDALYDDISVARRAQLHRRVAEALEVLYGADPEPYVAELAHHFFLAGPRGDVGKTIEYTRRAGDHAVTLLAYEEAVRHYQMSLRAFERRVAKDDSERCDVLLALGDAQSRTGDLPSAKATFLSAVELARNANAPEALARAALGYGGRFVWVRGAGEKRLVPLLEEALEALPDEDSELRVKLLARLAGALRAQPSREARAGLSREAVEMARRLGDAPTLAYALSARWTADWGPENPEERLRLADELLQIATAVGDKERALEGHGARLYALMELGDPAAATELEARRRLASELGQPAQLWLVATNQAMLALLQGRFAAAEELAASALRLGERAQPRDSLFAYRLQLYALFSEQNRLDELAETIERSVDEYPEYPVLRCVLAHLYSEIDRMADARREFETLAPDAFAMVTRDHDWLFGMSLLADVAHVLHDLPRAATLSERLLPWARRNAFSPPQVSRGAVSRSLGVLAEMGSRWDEGGRHFEHALESNARMAARPWVARTQQDHARMLLARGEPGDQERAHELLEACLATCHELGMPALADRAGTLIGARTAP